MGHRVTKASKCNLGYPAKAHRVANLRGFQRDSITALGITVARARVPTDVN